MCVNCGKDMTEQSYVTTSLDANRAKIQMVHDNTALTVSADQARHSENEAKRRLLASKKLSLVVDLDQTIIHATVDPTVAEWKSDPDNPNYESLQDVREFQLLDDGPGGRGTWYYIKFRPGLQQFLENVAALYEMHIYTMGTRAYAQHIAQLVDPDRKLFGDRILSRDESGSLVAKDLQRIFPVDTSMVAVIDDRADVWNWNANLVKVTPFSFFIGIGDINSSFLPTKPKIRTTPKPIPDSQKDAESKPSTTEDSPENSSVQNGDSKDQASSDDPGVSNGVQQSAVEQLMAMGGGDDPKTIEEQTAKQDEALATQLQERPLAQMQKQLDAEDGESESDSESKPRHHLLNDNDNELIYLESALRTVHTKFYDLYANSLPDVPAPRVAELRGSSTNPSPADIRDNLTKAPDITAIMPKIKQNVLRNVKLVFSGVIPLDTEVQSSEISIWAKSFGATIQERVSGKTTTHVVAARNRTAKVRQAVRKGKGRIKVVSLHWLMDSIVQWRHLNESPYLLQTDVSEIGRPLPGEDEMLSESEEINSTLETDTEANNTENEENIRSRRRPIKITINPPKRPRLEMDIDFDQAEFEALSPTIDKENSPIGGTKEDWDDMNNELAEFLGSDAEDDAMEDEEDDKRSVSSRTSALPNGNGPGKHSRDDTEDEEDGEGDRQVKKVRTINRAEDVRPPPIHNIKEVDDLDDDDDDMKALEDEFERELEGK